MAHKRPGVFKGQVRGVSHQGQEKTLHLKAEYIDADFPSFETFPLHSHGGPYIQQVRRARWFGALNLVKTPYCGNWVHEMLSLGPWAVRLPNRLGEVRDAADRSVPTA